MIVAGAENRPPMLDKSMYNSWQSSMLLYIKGKKNGRMMLESIENGSLVYLTIEENGAIRPKKYEELTKQEKLQDDCDIQETNIILKGLLPYAYSLVNHHQAAKDIWDRVNLRMKGTKLTYQECECKLYNEFDKFTLVKGLAIPSFLLGDDPITCLNKAMEFMSTMMAFMSTVMASCFFLNQQPTQNIFQSKKPSYHSRWQGYCSTSIRDTGLEFCWEYGKACTQPKKLRNFAWFKEKMLLVQAHKSGQENKIVNESLTTELERYKERVKTFEQRFNIDLSSRENFIDSQMDEMIWNRNALK
nr:hypothetical protein [Tanacetum cinerariifolium]